MKKISFIAVALATVLLVGCKPTPDPEPTVNSVTLDKTELTLAVGAEEMLKATVDPAGTAVAWASSDNAVAIVTGGGMVSAVAEGTAVITATAGEKTAECVITVTADAFYDQFNVAGYGLFGEFTPVTPAVDSLMDLDGDSLLYKCSLCTIQMVYAWDGNANFVSGTGFVGNGLVFSCPNVPVWVITDVQDPADEMFIGYYLNGGGFAVRNTNGETIPYVGDAGQIDIETYGDWVQTMYSSSLPEDFDIKAAFAEMESKTWGAMIAQNVDDMLDSDYGLYSGHINKLLFLDTKKDPATGDVLPAMFAADVTWANITAEDRLYGYKVDMEHYESTYVDGEGGEILLVQPYDYSTINRVFDVNGLFETEEEEPTAARKYTIGDMAKYHKVLPEFKGNKDNKTFHKANK